MKTALLLIAHGSRQEEANADLHHVAAGLRARGREIVEASFLELAEPNIAEAGARCVAQGAERVILVPYFLSAGVHVRRDLSAARARLAERFPAIEFCLAEPLGRHPLLLDVVIERTREVETR
ncbi:MAG TPA: CbiX/SirB N-terminal domain-containing protein [Gemmataceae bacterium]